MGSAPYYAYGAGGLVSDNSASLNKIPSASIKDEDVAVAIENNKIYFYIMNTSSGEPENVPYVIKPEDETSDKRWILISQEIYTTDIVQLVGNYIQTSHIKTIEGENLEIEANNGSKIIISTNGDVTFPSYASVSVAPTANDEMTNKEYVDTEISDKETELKSYVDDNIDSKDIELKSYVDDQFGATETDLQDYVDANTQSLSADFKDYVDTETQSMSADLQEYVDSKTLTMSGNLEQYVDNEYDNVITNVYPVLKFTTDSWSLSGDVYYSDINHQKGNKEVVIRCWDENDRIVYPYEIEAIDTDNSRIWVSDSNTTLTVVVV